MTNPTPTHQAGDLVFCHSKGIVGRGIRLAEHFRRDWIGTERAGERWNHVAMLDTLDQTGEWTVIQAEARGVTRGALLSTIAPGGEFEVLVLPSGIERARMLGFARAQVGSKYGFFTIASILITLFTPRFFDVMLPNTWICSAVTGESMRAGGWIHQWPDIYEVSPAELYIALKGKP